MMSEDELDLTQLAELQDALNQDLQALVATVVSDVERNLDQVDRALFDDDLAAARRAAHAARNGALLIDDRTLLDALAELETSAQEGDHARVRSARAALHERWPSVRGALERAAGAG